MTSTRVASRRITGSNIRGDGELQPWSAACAVSMGICFYLAFLQVPKEHHPNTKAGPQNQSFCLNNSTLFEGINSTYYCDCKPGWNGLRCNHSVSYGGGSDDYRVVDSRSEANNNDNKVVVLGSTAWAEIAIRDLVLHGYLPVVWQSKNGTEYCVGFSRQCVLVGRFQLEVDVYCS
jgi:hypothetical protein